MPDTIINTTWVLVYLFYEKDPGDLNELSISQNNVINIMEYIVGFVAMQLEFQPKYLWYNY